MNKMTKIAGLLTIGFALGASLGCDEQQGTLERAGERADEVIDNAKDGDPLFERKGPMEKAGESVDRAVNDVTN